MSGSNFGECVWSYSVHNKWYDEADRNCAELKYEMPFSFCAIKIIEEFTKNTTKKFDSFSFFVAKIKIGFEFQTTKRFRQSDCE